jgi:hypothetical protein
MLLKRDRRRWKYMLSRFANSETGLRLPSLNP